MPADEAAPIGSPVAATEPSPLARLGPTLRRLPRYLVLARNLLRDPNLSRWRKAGLVASLAYAVSPIDLVPGVIPVAGQLDDLAAVILGIRTALGGFKSGAAAGHLRSAGLTAEDIEADLVTVRSTAGWIAGLAGVAAAGAARVAVRGAANVLGMGARGARAVAARAAKRVR